MWPIVERNLLFFFCLFYFLIFNGKIDEKRVDEWTKLAQNGNEQKPMYEYEKEWKYFWYIKNKIVGLGSGLLDLVEIIYRL